MWNKVKDRGGKNLHALIFTVLSRWNPVAYTWYSWLQCSNFKETMTDLASSQIPDPCRTWNWILTTSHSQALPHLLPTKLTSCTLHSLGSSKHKPSLREEGGKRPSSPAGNRWVAYACDATAQITTWTEILVQASYFGSRMMLLALPHKQDTYLGDWDSILRNFPSKKKLVDISPLVLKTKQKRTVTEQLSC